MTPDGAKMNRELVRIVMLAVVLGVVFGGLISGFAYWSIVSADPHLQGDAIMSAEILLGRARYPFGTFVESFCRRLFVANAENAGPWCSGSLPIMINGAAWVAAGMGAVALGRKAARR